MLPLNASETELEAALRALEEGLSVGVPALLRGLLRQASALEAADSAPLPDPLTGREIEVLQMMSQGLANKQIGHSRAYRQRSTPTESARAVSRRFSRLV